MASDSLSQNEIDLLFGGGEQAEPAGMSMPETPENLQVYDFRHPARISKDRKRSLTAMYNLLAKSIEGWIAGRTREQVDLQLQSVEQLSFGEFVLALPSPCASFVVDVGDTGLQGVIDFGHELGYCLVDRLMGGAGAPMVLERPLSAVERMVVRLAAEKVAQQLEEIWKDYVRLDLELSGFESIPEMLQVANREDPVLLAHFGLTVGDLSSVLLVCLPFMTLEKFFTGASTRRTIGGRGTAEERVQDRAYIEASLRTARVTVGARLPAFEMSLDRLLSLKPGAVLPTGLSPDTELELHVAGQRRFLGTPGRVGKQLAVRVLASLEPEPEELIHPGRESGF